MNLEQHKNNENQKPEDENLEKELQDTAHHSDEAATEEINSEAEAGHHADADHQPDETTSDEQTADVTPKDSKDIEEGAKSSVSSVNDTNTSSEPAENTIENVVDEVAEAAETVAVDHTEPDTENADSPAEAEVKEEELNAEQYYAEIAKKAGEFVIQNDWAYVSGELANLRLQIEEGPEPDTDAAGDYIKEFERIREEFETKKREYYEEQNKKKQENLTRKKELLKEFADIINNEQWTATKEVSKIHNEWEQIRLLPQNEADALNERFASLMADFEDHKVDRLVKKLQKEEENLTLKLVLQDKMDAILEQCASEDSNFEAFSKELNNLMSQWRKVGHVPVEKNEMVWDKFNSTVDRFNELRYQFDSLYRKAIDKATEQKKKLVADAERLMEEENLADAARRVNKLHKAWKKAKTLPQKDENELWELFKAATDAFNEKKAANIDVLRDQEQKNMELKQALIDKAESIQHTEDFEAGHKVMQLLMDEWKKIGPVPRKKSSKMWSSFKTAMDVFYEERREHFKDIRQDQKDNLNEKKIIIDKLIELGEHEDPAKAVEAAKQLQDDFKKIGHVPLKSKNKIWKQYREACDVIYERYRSMGADLSMERKLASQGVEPKDRKQVIKLEKELNHVKKDISRLEAEIIQFEEAQTYFKPTKKGNKLLDDLQTKIENASSQLTEKKERQNTIEIEIEQLTNADED